MTPQLDVIGVIVSDMGRALTFYRQLGLDIPAEADSQDHVEVLLKGGLRLAFDTESVVRSFDPDWQRPTSGHRIGLSFLCDSPADVDSHYEQMVGAGYQSHLKPWDAFWGQRYAVVRDPDGNPIDLFAPLR
jgi:uncharacterized glyoxalase superfamily protein PhnB